MLSFVTNAQIPHELLITEVMADPTPSRGLPEKEYIELYNNSSRIIQLSDYKLQYNVFEANLPTFSIIPAQYVILVRKGNEATFDEFGQVLSLDRLSLINSGTTLRLMNAESVIHQLNYSESWYAAGRTQGYALEMIDLNYPCVEKENWTSSPSEIGGTPGGANASTATNPDVTPPLLLFFDAETPAQITFNFNEKLDTVVAKQKQQYVFSTGESIKEIRISDNGKDVLLELNEEIPENVLIDVSIKNLTDCSGNVADDINISIGNLPPSDSGVVVLNEVLFNPKLGGGDYIELYNRSENAVSLKNWSFATFNSDNEIVAEQITEFNLLIEPFGYLVFTENVAFLSEFYPDYKKDKTVLVNKLPSLRNTDGTILLLNELGRVFDRFDYNEDLHHPIIDDPDGVALEKISADKPSRDLQNWQSAAEEVQFGTPGYLNSQRESESDAGQTVWVEPQIFTPDLDGFADQAELKFSLKTNGNVATVQVLTVSGVAVKLLAQNKLLGNSSSIFWDGTDESGNELPVGYYIFVVDIFTPSGITERFRIKVVLARAN